MDQTFYMREIVSGPDRLREVGDYHAWLFKLQDENRQEERVEFRLTGSAGATGESFLPPKVAEARRTNGLSIVQSLLFWDRIPPVVEACTDWITLRHANGYLSHIDHRRPKNGGPFEAMLERSVIRIRYRQGVEETYMFNSPGWLKQSLQNGRAWPTEPLMLSDVLGRLSGEQRQQALDLDPQGAANLPSLPLNESEKRAFVSLLHESQQDSVEEIRIELTHGQPLAWEEVAELLDALRVREYVEEFEPGRWRVTTRGHASKRRLLGEARAAVA